MTPLDYSSRVERATALLSAHADNDPEYGPIGGQAKRHLPACSTGRSKQAHTDAFTDMSGGLHGGPCIPAEVQAAY